MSDEEEQECLLDTLPRVDSNHDSAVQSRMSCHWTTGQTSGAVEINRWGKPGQIIPPRRPSKDDERIRSRGAPVRWTGRSNGLAPDPPRDQFGRPGAAE